jgi:molybdenum cofactor synthesis domain-containing protein
MFKVGIITVSDRCFKKEREDKSGKTIKDILLNNDYEVIKYIIVPDEEGLIYKELLVFSDDLKLDLILTTGGTGLAKRDVTPEATKKAIKKSIPGIAEAIRNYSLSVTKRAMLSRAVSGLRNQTLIINLPGSPKAAEETLNYVLDVLPHALEVIKGNVSDCAR